MSDKSRLNVQVSPTRSITIHGTRHGKAIAVTKAVCTEYRGWVLLLGANGKVYSPHISGIHMADLHKVTGRNEMLMRGLQTLGAVTAEEAEAAVAKGSADEERRERRAATYALRDAATRLGIKIPAAMERRLGDA